ncbi:hypothetical protein PAXINDRAFT_85798, partial [Paxillus involutus ATCC 200175]
FFVMNCGEKNLILRLPWLREVNPIVDWKEGTLTFPDCLKKPRHDSQDQITQQYLIQYLGMDPDLHMSKKLLKQYDPLFKEFQKTTISSEIAQEAEKKKEKATLPSEYSEFADIFKKKATNHVSPSCSFNHEIKLDKDFVPKVAKVYPLNPKESTVCKEFVKEHLETSKISPLKSPQASHFFFVPQKDGSLCPCQDY